MQATDQTAAVLTKIIYRRIILRFIFNFHVYYRRGYQHVRSRKNFVHLVRSIVCASTMPDIIDVTGNVIWPKWQ